MNAPDRAKEIRGVVAAAIGFLTALWGWAGWAVMVWAALILIDYITGSMAAKREKNQNESRIRYLENMIRTAVIVEDHGGDDEVTMNKSVEVYFPDDDETETYRIVTTIRGNSRKGLISIDSPLGKALLHHKVGDTVEVHVNKTTSYEVEIRSISAAADEEEDEIRKF